MTSLPNSPAPRSITFTAAGDSGVPSLMLSPFKSTLCARARRVWSPALFIHADISARHQVDEGDRRGIVELRQRQDGLEIIMLRHRGLAAHHHLHTRLLKL